LKETKELEARALQPVVRICSDLLPYTIPQSFFISVCPSLRRPCSKLPW